MSDLVSVVAEALGDAMHRWHGRIYSCDHTDEARYILDAALGDEGVYVKHHADGSDFRQCSGCDAYGLIQVWPVEDPQQ